MRGSKGKADVNAPLATYRCWLGMGLGFLLGLASCTPGSQDGLAPIPRTPVTPVCTYSVVNTYPHDPDAFTQGLVHDNGDLFEGTGLIGSSSLRRVDLETGEVLQVFNLLGDHFGEGVTLHNHRLIQLTYLTQTAFVYDRDTFALLDQFSYPTQGWGLTHDGQRLIMSDGSSTLYFRDPATFAKIGQVQVHDDQGPVTRLNELEYINGEVFANIWQTDLIAKIDPATGQVIAYIYMGRLLQRAPGVLNGIAWDVENDRLFVTGKRWPSLFEIELVGCPSLHD